MALEELQAQDALAKAAMGLAGLASPLSMSLSAGRDLQTAYTVCLRLSLMSKAMI